MGCCCSKYAHIYEENLYLKSLQQQFDALQLRKGEVGAMYDLFRKIDVDKSGAIAVDEMMTHFNIDKSDFRDRVFSIFDEDNSGQVDFREFVLSLWNYCTLNKSSLALFAFDLYDKDSTGELEPIEIDQMLRDLYGEHAKTKPQAKFILQEIQKLGESTFINVDRFQKFVHSHPALLFPAFQMQNSLRLGVFGIAYWERAAERRIKLSQGLVLRMEQVAQMNVSDADRQTGLAKIQQTAGQKMLRPKDELKILLVDSATGTKAFRKAKQEEVARKERVKHHTATQADRQQAVEDEVYGKAEVQKIKHGRGANHTEQVADEKADEFAAQLKEIQQLQGGGKGASKGRGGGEVKLLNAPSSSTSLLSPSSCLVAQQSAGHGHGGGHHGHGHGGSRVEPQPHGSHTALDELEEELHLHAKHKHGGHHGSHSQQTEGSQPAGPLHHYPSQHGGHHQAPLPAAAYQPEGHQHGHGSHGEAAPRRDHMDGKHHLHHAVSATAAGSRPNSRPGTATKTNNKH